MGAPTPVSRDLTSTFKRFRNERRGRGGRGGLLAGDVTGQRLLSNDEPSRPGEVAIQMTELPPQWIESAEQAKDDLKAIREKMAQLGKMQAKRLQKVFDDDGKPDSEVEAVSSQIGSLCKRCEASIHQIKAQGGGGTQKDHDFRTNVQRNLATQLQTISQNFRQSQKEYLGKIRKRQRGALWDDTAAVGVEGGGVDAGFDDAQLMELEGMETNANQRSEEICRIASSISDLHTIFKELAVLVIDQGTILDRIDYNIEQVVDQSREANVQLQKAEKSSKSNRAMKCMLMMVMINMVLLIVLIVKARS